MSGLITATLSSVCTLVTDGTHDTPKTLPEGIPFIKAKQIADGYIDFDDCEYISYKDHLKVISRSKPEQGDTLFAHIGATLGATAYINTNVEFSIKNVALFKPNPEKIIPRYLYYVVLSDVFQNGIKNYRTGAAQPFVSLEILRNQSFTYHEDMNVQRKIVDVLSAYDDLIEVNTRRIRILEQMAQSVYHEWFGKVDVKSLPEGWEIVKLGDACNIVMGQSPASEFYNEEGKGLPFHQGVTNFGDRYPTDKVFCTVENRIAEKGDILFSVRAPVGRLNISTKKIVIGRGLSAIRSKTGNQSFVFQQLKEQFHEDDMMGGGTIFKSVTKDDVLGIKFLLPPKELIDKFENFANPISRALEILTAKNTNLRRTRDLLLPRLVSGEVGVHE